MNRMIAALLIAVAFASPSRAQTTPAAPLITAPAPTSLDLLPIGRNFGKDGAYQFGLDRSQTIGACAGYSIPGHIFLTGPCRDLFVFSRSGRSVAHLGGFLGYGLADIGKSHPYWSVRAGFNIGGAAAAGLNKLADDLPMFDALSTYKAPSWLSYAGKIGTVDYFGGYDGAGHWAHGPMAKFDIPLADLAALLASAGGK